MTNVCDLFIPKPRQRVKERERERAQLESGFVIDCEIFKSSDAVPPYDTITDHSKKFTSTVFRQLKTYILFNPLNRVLFHSFLKMRNKETHAKSTETLLSTVEFGRTQNFPNQFLKMQLISMGVRVMKIQRFSFFLTICNFSSTQFINIQTFRSICSITVIEFDQNV